jgi:type VI secretion system protein ImpI/type VI secretion system protein
MRLQQVGLAVGLAALAGCTSTASTGVVAMGPDMYGMKVVSRNLAGAAEKGLTDATTFCNGMGRQTQLLRTQITTEDYQLVFRCMGSAPVVVPPPANPVPSIAGMAIPNPNGPVLAGPAFMPPRTVGSATMDRMAAQNRTAIFPTNPPILANPAAPPSPPLPALGNTSVAPFIGQRGARPPSYANTPLPAAYAPPPIGGPSPLAAPSYTPMAPLVSPGRPPAAVPEPEATRPGFFGRLFGSGEAPRSPALPQPGFNQPGFTPASNSAPLGIFQTPTPAAPLPPSTQPLEPLRSPLGNAPSFTPAFAPGSAPLAPIAAPPALQAPALQPLAAPAPLQLAPVPEPAATPSRALPPVPLQPLPRLSTNVPNTLPPPASLGGAAPTVPQPISTEPPTTFWQTPRN